MARQLPGDGGARAAAEPMARQLPGDGGARAAAEPTLPSEVIEQLLRFRHADTHGSARCTFTVAGRRLECSFLSTLGSNELLFRLAETHNGDADKALLQRAHALTSREAEVLLWISRGKSNRDIGQILDISPRTVNKHLEQVFVKLGVENRAAAAAVAVRSLTLSL
jgi:DNA-binding CsgD family transcriptional regulator